MAFVVVPFSDAPSRVPAWERGRSWGWGLLRITCPVGSSAFISATLTSGQVIYIYEAALGGPCLNGTTFPLPTPFRHLRRRRLEWCRVPAGHPFPPPWGSSCVPVETAMLRQILFLEEAAFPGSSVFRSCVHGLPSALWVSELQRAARVVCQPLCCWQHLPWCFSLGCALSVAGYRARLGKCLLAGVLGHCWLFRYISPN